MEEKESYTVNKENLVEFPTSETTELEQEQLVKINEDEMIKFIQEKAFQNKIKLTQEQIEAVLNLELDFMISKGLVQTEEF